MSYEVSADDDGNYFIASSEGDVLQLPLVSVHEGATVCEFIKLQPSLSLSEIVRLIQDELLGRFFDGAHRAEFLELVDLEEQAWVRVRSSSPVSEMQWVSVREAWPPGIETRKTALAGAPRHSGLQLLSSIDGYRFKWTAACVSPKGSELATAHGKKGEVWCAKLAGASIEKLPPAGVPLHQLLWLAGDMLLGLARRDRHVHVYHAGAWSQHDLGTGPLSDAARSADGRLLAFTCSDGNVAIFERDGDLLVEKKRFLPNPEATPKPKWLAAKGTAVHGVQWSPDADQLFVGHAWPIVAAYDWRSGALAYVLEGTQHFQRRFAVGPHKQLAASLLMAVDCVYDGAGRLSSELPNASGYAMASAGFARGGRLLITEHNDGVAKIWNVESRLQLSQQSCAQGEPLITVDDALIVRDAKGKQLRVFALPQ